jgi:tetratricopeptide (TPR) repeat protein
LLGGPGVEWASLHLRRIPAIRFSGQNQANLPIPSRSAEKAAAEAQAFLKARGGFMNVSSSRFRVVLALAILVSLPAAMAAQMPKGGPPSRISPQPTSMQPLYISGRVLLENGTAPSEPVTIERVCNGAVRKQGSTDSKGSFQFHLDQNRGFQDASENGSDSGLFNTASQASGQPQDAFQTQEAFKQQYQGCEIRAVLPGFISSRSVLRLQSGTWQYDVGTIFIKRMESAPGTTVSVTTMNAPGEAKRAFDKGHKAFDENKFSDAEQELGKAVKIYPNFAAAWSLLGDIHLQQKQYGPAINDYTQALAADSQFVNPSFGLALIAIQEKRWQDAVQFTDQVAKLNSLAFPAAYYYNAVANLSLGRMEPAEQSARKFKSLDTEHRHPDVCLMLGQLLVKKNDFAAAAHEMREYLTLVPNAANAEEVRQWLKRYDEISAAKPRP